MGGTKVVNTGAVGVQSPTEGARPRSLRSVGRARASRMARAMAAPAQTARRKARRRGVARPSSARCSRNRADRRSTNSGAGVTRAAPCRASTMNASGGFPWPSSMPEASSMYVSSRSANLISFLSFIQAPPSQIGKLIVHPGTSFSGRRRHARPASWPRPSLRRMAAATSRMLNPPQKRSESASRRSGLRRGKARWTQASRPFR